MRTHKLFKVLSLVICCSVLFLYGCAKYLQPDIGATAQPEARIELPANGIQDGVFQTKDLELNYSLLETGTTIRLTGKLTFDRRLTDSFPIANKFSLKMSFLDGEGNVLDTVDISPVNSIFSRISGVLSVNGAAFKPEGSSYIAFNYFGEFKGEGFEQGSNSWDIFYFPYGEL